MNQVSSYSGPSSYDSLYRYTSLPVAAYTTTTTATYVFFKIIHLNAFNSYALIQKSDHSYAHLIWRLFFSGRIESALEQESTVIY